jgi:hypothetical protein
MKKIILSASICLFSFAAFSQGQLQVANPVKAQKQQMVQQAKQSAEERAKTYSNELKKTLNLSDDQYAKVMAVNTECIKRKDALKAGTGDKAAGFKEIAQYRRQQFQTILTPAQMTQLKNAQMTKAPNMNKAPGANMQAADNGE